MIAGDDSMGLSPRLCCARRVRVPVRRRRRQAGESEPGSPRIQSRKPALTGEDMNVPLTPFARRLILGGALLGALVVSLGPNTPTVHADEGAPPQAIVRDVMIAQADVSKAAKEAAGPAKSAPQTATPA